MVLRMAGGGASLAATTRQSSRSSSAAMPVLSSATGARRGALLMGTPIPELAPFPHQQRSSASVVRRTSVQTRALDPAHLADALTSGLAAVPLAAQVVAPCNVVKCGDIIYASTLDPVLRGEVTGPSWQTFVAVALALAYLCVPPGVLPGAVDYYILSKLRSRYNAYSKDDITLGRKLGSGGFGSAFLGEMRMADGTVQKVIVKKATEFGQAEAWMNERMMRLGGAHVAEFITAFDETLHLSAEERARRDKRRQRYTGVLHTDAVWLVWRYEGDNSLWSLMEAKDFPYNLEPLLLDRELRLPKGAERKAVTIRLALKQLLEALAVAHGTGIVHRDVKPQNCIISERDKKLKLIDLGAAADLRIGINYAPNEYLLDPRYAPPQQYVMSTQTPTPPPAPVAAFLSPVLWRMENPDRFDMYSCGITLLQMCFSNLRSNNNLNTFNTRFEALNYDLAAWRAEEESRRGGPRPEVADGFAILDLDEGAGWKLLRSLLAYKPSDRCSAVEALASPFFCGSDLSAPSEHAALAAASQSALAVATRALAAAVDARFAKDFVDGATGQDRGSLTEAMLLTQELDPDDVAPPPPKRASHTLRWWKDRQSEMRRSIERRQEGSMGTGGLPVRGAARPGSPDAQRNGNGKGKARVAASPERWVLPKWGSNEEVVQQKEEREVELVGQERGGGLGFLGNMLGGGGRNGKNNNNN